MQFVKTTDATGYFHRLRLRIVDYLVKYKDAFNSIRLWAAGSVINDFTITGISGTIQNGAPAVNVIVKGLGIASVPAQLTYSVTTSTTTPKMNELETSWSNFSSSMLTLIGSSESSTNSVRKVIFDKITNVVNLYNKIVEGKSNRGYASAYNWIPEAPSGKGNKVRQGGCAFGDFEYGNWVGGFCSPDEPKNYDTTNDDFAGASSSSGICALDSTRTQDNPVCTNLPSEDTVKAAKSTDLRELMRLWNKYNIYDDLDNEINSGKQSEYEGVLNKYKALRTAYINFQTTFGSTVSPALMALDTTKYTVPDTLTVGSSGNYSDLYSTYGEPTTSGKFKDLIAFIRGDSGQLKNYINRFSTLVAARSSLTVKELGASSSNESFDTSFYSDIMKTNDLAALPTKSPDDLINLMQNYALYTNQYKVRDSKYNTLVVIDHFENLVVKNKDYVDIFPADIILGTCVTATSSDATISFDLATGATLAKDLASSTGDNKIGKTIKRLVCDMVEDIDLINSFAEADAPSASALGSSPATNTTLEANLATFRNKYTKAFEWLFGQLKTNLETLFTKHETLFERYTEFRTGFNAFSALFAIPGTVIKIPTIPSTNPVKTYKTLLSETTFNSPNQLDCINAIDSIRNAYVGDSGVYKLLTAHVLDQVFTKTGNFRSTLDARIGSSLIAAATKPTLPAAITAC
jgi:hypothetical protein